MFEEDEDLECIKCGSKLWENKQRCKKCGYVFDWFDYIKPGTIDSSVITAKEDLSYVKVINLKNNKFINSLKK